MSVSNPNPNSIIFSRLDCVEENNYKLSFVTYPDDESLADLEFPSLKNPAYLCFHGHIHGIICLSDYDDIYLYNPTTLDLHHLPPSILPQVTIGKSFQLDSMTIAVGFGFDHKSKDYKVVRVVDYNEYPSRVEIYTLSTDQWREIDLTSVFGFSSMNSSFQMYHEGFYYWLADIMGKDYIKFFDMSKEVFGTIPLPESFEYREYGEYRSLGVWNGYIVIFHFKDRITLDIWGMKNGYGWCKLFTGCCPVSGINQIFLFVDSDELLIEAKDGQVFSYNLTTQKLTNLHVNANDSVNFLCFGIEKTQSTLSVMGERFLPVPPIC